MRKPKGTLTFRISDKTRKDLYALAEAFGKPTTTFVGEFVETMCRGEWETLGAFLARLQRGMMKQYELELGQVRKRPRRRRRANSG